MGDSPQRIPALLAVMTSARAAKAVPQTTFVLGSQVGADRFQIEYFLLPPRGPYSRGRYRSFYSARKPTSLRDVTYGSAVWT